MDGHTISQYKYLESVQWGIFRSLPFSESESSGPGTSWPEREVTCTITARYN